MKRLVTIVLLTACMSFLHAQNIIRNGDFESGMNSWKKGFWDDIGEAEIDSKMNQGPFGSKALLFRGKEGEYGKFFVLQNFRIPAGPKKNYKFSCWIRTADYENQWSAVVTCTIHGKDQNGTPQKVSAGFSTPWQKKSTEWTNYSKTFDLPDSECHGSIYVMVKPPTSKQKGNGPNAVTHFDNFYLGPADSAPETQPVLPNGNQTAMKLSGAPYQTNGFYRVGEPVTWELTLENAPAEPLRMDWTACDGFGKKINSGAQDLKLGSGKQKFRFTLPPCKTMGFISVKVKVFRRNGIFAEHSLSAVRTQRRNQPDPFFTWQGWRQPDVNGKNNMGSLRIGCLWNTEIKPGVYDFSKIDRDIALAEKNGLTPLGYTCVYVYDSWRNPAYNREQIKKAIAERRNPFDEAHYLRYRNWARALIKHVGTRIKDWAIVNEIDLSRNGFMEEENYIRCTKIFSEELKKQFPDHTIGAIGIAGPEFRSEQNYLRKLWKELGPYLDGIYYDAYTPGRFGDGYELPCDEKYLCQYLEKTRSIIGPDKLISIEEKGFTVEESLPVDHPVLVKNAHHLTRSYLLAKTVPNVIRYAYFLRNDGAREGKFNYGMIHNNGNPRPMSAAFAAAADFFANTENGVRINPMDSIYACIFKRGNQTLCALWTLEKNVVNATIKFPVDHLESDYMGNIAKRSAGVRHLKLTEAPLFFEMQLPQEQFIRMIREGVYELPEVSGSIRQLSEDTLAVEVKNRTQKTISVNVRFGQNPPLSGTLKAGETKSFLFQRPFRNGSVNAELFCNGKTYPLTAYLEAVPVTRTGTEFVMDTAQWLYPVDAIPAGLWRGKEDLSAKLNFSYDDNFFHLRADVVDDKPFSTASGVHIWNQDAIQFGFDTENAEGKSLAGYCEFCVALTPEGPQLYCYKSINSDPAAEGILRDAKVSVKQITPTLRRYECAIPWKYLGKMKERTGNFFGLNLVIFDRDDPKQGITYWMQLSPGITGGKAPEQFKKFYLKKK
ncbi:MAG: carbohydrate binding domain-containing protein [Lentisphaeria bacterium]|nr:carbohydrate binding domain-containing protein [Lentisphaeria bacterium]